MGWPEPRRSRALLAAWLAAVFALSAVTEPLHLSLAGAAAVVLLHRGAARNLRRVLLAVAPLGGGLALASWAWLRLLHGAWPPAGPFLALALRTCVIAFVTFSALDRIDLFGALAPFPALTRLLVLTLAQAHALRLLVTDSLLALRSRLPRTPRALDVVRGSGGIAAALFTLSARNARDTSDAMRSRGF